MDQSTLGSEDSGEPVPWSTKSTANLGFGSWNPPGRHDSELGVWLVDEEVENRFPETGVDVFASVDEVSFWFRHRNVMLSKALTRHAPTGTILEVGSGSGVVAGHLAASGRTVATVEPVRSGAIAAARRGVEASFCGDLASMKLPNACVPVIGAFDVIEHLADPRAVLDECARILAPSGKMVLTVPAHQWLWSDFDEWNGHVQRYSKNLLETQLRAAGLRPVHSTYFFLPLLLPAVFVRLLGARLQKGPRTDDEVEAKLAQQLAPSSPLVERLLLLVHRIEAAAYGRLPLPGGTSILMVAEKDC